jgi:hypothetical protein
MKVSALIKKEKKNSLYKRKSRRERLQSPTNGHIIYCIRKTFLIYDFATAPLWFPLYFLFYPWGTKSLMGTKYCSQGKKMSSHMILTHSCSLFLQKSLYKWLRCFFMMRKITLKILWYKKSCALSRVHAHQDGATWITIYNTKVYLWQRQLTQPPDPRAWTKYI